MAQPTIDTYKENLHFQGCPPLLDQEKKNDYISRNSYQWRKQLT